MKFLFKLIGASALMLLVAATAVYAVSKSGLKELDEDTRQRLGGNYLNTEHGVLSYTRQGPVDAPTVILVHGFSTPKFVWEQVMPTLVTAGYQVINYDHLGRGFSDRPAGPYNAALYRSELAGLIEGLQLSVPLRLVGYSMGGANVVDYAAEHPKHIKKLVLIAPAGYMPDAASATPLLAPVVGEWFTAIFGRQFARGAIASEVEAGLAPADMLEKFDQQAGFKGYTEALLSTLRHFPMASLADRYQVVGKAGIPVTAIWGTDDKIVPYTGAAEMAKDVTQLELITLTGGNHNITYARAPEVSQALLAALKETP